MGRAGIARLAGRVDANAVVPLPDIHDEAHRCAMRDAEISRTVARVHRRRAAPALRQGAHVHVRRGRVLETRQGVLEETMVQRAPAPARGSGPRRWRHSSGRRGERVGKERVAFPLRRGTEASVGRFQGVEHAVDISGQEKLGEGAVASKAREEARPQMAHPPDLEQGRRGTFGRGAQSQPNSSERASWVSPSVLPRRVRSRVRRRAGIECERRSARRKRADAVLHRSLEHFMDARRARALGPLMPDRHPLMRPIGGKVHLVRRRDETLLRIEAHGQIVGGDEALPIVAPIAGHGRSPFQFGRFGIFPAGSQAMLPSTSP